MKLVTLSGKSRALGQGKYSFSLFSMTGAADMLKLNPRELSDIDAGIWALYRIDRMYPGITWGDIRRARKGIGKQKLGRRWFEFGKLLSDIGDKTGEWSGDVIRLLTDREVREGITQYASGFATGGVSTGIQGFLGQLGSGFPDLMKSNLLRSLGQTAKGELIPGIPNYYLAIGGGGLLFMLLLLK